VRNNNYAPQNVYTLITLEDHETHVDGKADYKNFKVY